MYLQNSKYGYRKRNNYHAPNYVCKMFQYGSLHIDDRSPGLHG